MGDEAKYSPGLAAMDRESLEGAAKAAQSLTDRRFQDFEGDIEIIIGMDMYDEDLVQQVKELRMGIGDAITKYEEILSRLEAIYAMKPEKNEKQVKAMETNFGLISKRRQTVRTKCLEATRAIENERNKKEAKNQTTGRSSTGTTGSRGTGEEGEKMFKLPTGPLPEKISLEYTPLQADNWKADMKLFLKTCTNMQVLSIEEQTTLVKRYVETSMWPLVELERGDEIVTMIQKIGDAYDRQVPKFARKVKFLDLMILKGESYVSWANRINQQAELADLKNIRAQDLQLMTFCMGLNKTDRLYDKIVDMEIHSWSGAQEIIKKHTQSMALKADLVESAPRPQSQIMNQMSGTGVSKPRQASKSPGRQRIQQRKGENKVSKQRKQQIPRKKPEWGT